MFALRTACRRAWAAPDALSIADCALLLGVGEHKSEARIKAELTAWLREKGSVCEVVSLSKVYSVGQCVEGLRTLALKRKACRRARRLGCSPRKLQGLEESAATHKATLSEQFLLLCTPTAFTGRVFAVFASAGQRRLAEESLVGWLAAPADQPFWAERAGEPEGYVWENFGAGRAGRGAAWLRLFAGMSLVFLLAFALLLGLSYLFAVTLRGRLPAPLRREAMLCLNALLILSANSLLGRFIAGEHRRRVLFPAAQASRFLLTFATQLLNAAADALLLGAIVYRRRATPCFWRERGAAPLITAVLGMEAVAAVLGPLLDPAHLLRLYRRRQYRQTLAGGALENAMMQCDLNEAFEKAPYDVGGEHARVMAATGLSLLFQPVAPYAPLLALLTVAARLLWQRRTVVQCALRPRELGEGLVRASLLAVDVCVFLAAAGSLLFGTAAGGPLPWFSAAGVLLSLCLPVIEAGWCAPLFPAEKAVAAEAAGAYARANPVPCASGEGMQARLSALRGSLAAYTLSRYGWGRGAGNIYRADLADHFPLDEEEREGPDAFRLTARRPTDNELGLNVSRIFASQRMSDPEALLGKTLGALDDPRLSARDQLDESDSTVFVSASSHGAANSTPRFPQPPRAN